MGMVVAQRTLDFTDNLKEYEPNYVFHGDDWRKVFKVKSCVSDLAGVGEWFDEVFPLGLSDFGVKKEDISGIVKLATTGGQMDNNPIVFSEDGIEDILNSVF